MKKFLFLVSFLFNVHFCVNASQNDVTTFDLSNMPVENNVSHQLEKQVSKSEPFITKKRCLKALVVVGAGFGMYKLSKKATPYITRFLFPTLTRQF